MPHSRTRNAHTRDAVRRQLTCDVLLRVFSPEVQGCQRSSAVVRCYGCTRVRVPCACEACASGLVGSVRKVIEYTQAPHLSPSFPHLSDRRRGASSARNTIHTCLISTSHMLPPTPHRYLGKGSSTYCSLASCTRLRGGSSSALPSNLSSTTRQRREGSTSTAKVRALACAARERELRGQSPRDLHASVCV